MSSCYNNFFIKHYTIRTLLSNYIPINDECIYQKLNKDTNTYITQQCGNNMYSPIYQSTIIQKLYQTLNEDINKIDPSNRKLFIKRILAYLNDIISDIFCFCKCSLNPSYLLLELLKPNAILFILYHKADNRPCGFSIINLFDAKFINDILVKYFNTFAQFFHKNYDIDAIYNLSPFITNIGFTKNDIQSILQYHHSNNLQKRNMYILDILKTIYSKSNFYSIEIFCSNAPYKGGQCLFEFIYKYLNVSPSKSNNIILIHEPIPSAFDYYTKVMNYISNDFILFDKDNLHSKLKYIFKVIPIVISQDDNDFYNLANEYSQTTNTFIDKINNYPIRQTPIKYIDEDLQKRYREFDKLMKQGTNKDDLPLDIDNIRLYNLMKTDIPLTHIKQMIKKKDKSKTKKHKI